MDWKIVHIDETDSTNRWLKENSHELTANGQKHIVVVADYQTAG